MPADFFMLLGQPAFFRRWKDRFAHLVAEKLENSVIDAIEPTIIKRLEKREGVRLGDPTPIPPAPIVYYRFDRNGGGQSPRVLYIGFGLGIIVAALVAIFLLLKT